MTWLSLHSAYLTGRQLHVWDMTRRGLSQSAIARDLRISRQAVNQLTQLIPDKVATALRDAASLNRVDTKIVDPVRGVLVGWSNEFRTDVVITLNAKVGLRVWYQHNMGRCKICPDKKTCRSTLLETANEHSISLTPAERNLEPSQLSSLIFSRLIGSDAATGTGHSTIRIASR